MLGWKLQRKMTSIFGLNNLNIISNQGFTSPTSRAKTAKIDIKNQKTSKNGKK